jgi:cysteine desulfurase
MIYLDNNATTRVDPWVAQRSLKYLTEPGWYANPSSSHSGGRKARHVIDSSRKLIANYLGVKPEEVYFTSGATESNNIAIRGCFFANKKKGKHIITTCVEHASVHNVCEMLKKRNKCSITYLPVDQFGRINLRDLANAIRPDTILISIMGANNEIGTIMPLNVFSKF